MQRGLAVLLALILASSGVLSWPRTGHAVDSSWAWKSVLSGTSKDLKDVSFGNGRWVAVGDKGTIITSMDGIKWNLSKSGTDEDITGVTFGDGKFVAVGRNSALVSTDGVNWTSYSVRPEETLGNLFDVAYGNDMFVAVGQPYQYYSADGGKTWSQTDTYAQMRSVTFGDGVFVGVSSRGPYASQDGMKWTEAVTDEDSGNLVDLYTVTYSLGKFVAGGRILRG
ncbi:MAG TPA: hypothetical protein VD973_22640, partial [Symbiobacteriaceae bacterium]|nr:hypothetical protein [Symbiobacteriaceae bacterium]